MGKVSPEVVSLVQKYIQELERNNIHIRKAVLFGSHVNGTPDEWSDIDIVLVSDDFEGSRFNDKDRLRRITLSIDPSLSPLPYNTEDFSENDPFVRHITETGYIIQAPKAPD